MARLITWFDVDDDLARTDWTPRAWLSVCVFAGFFNVGLSIIGARHYDANWRVIWAVYVAYVIVYALNTFVVGIDRLITSHRWCIVAGLPFSLAMTSVYGAAARDPASAAYGALFVGAIMIARSTRGWAVALAIVVVNVVLRVWAHPAAPVSTLLLTTTIALAAAAIFLLASQPTAELLRTQVAIDAAHALTTIASERAAALTVAMSLHDGLSGILYAAKRRAKDASLDEARTIARSVLAEARRVLGSAPSRYDDDAIAGGLVQAARGLG
ncbi:MAG: hypothetical protein ACXWP4_17300, partial [Polyangiales bacterium]